VWPCQRLKPSDLPMGPSVVEWHVHCITANTVVFWTPQALGISVELSAPGLHFMTEQLI
jgi:hypothetical protein